MALERDGAEALLTAALAQLQRRLSAPPSAAPRKLYEELRVLLTRAIRAQVLQNGMYAVKQLLRLTPDPERRARCWVLTGGPLDFGRTADAALETHFIRADGGVVHFHLTLRETDTGEVDVLAYGFEVYFPSRDPIAFVRFDLNLRGHDNDESGLRSHLHPGNDDLQLPSPVLTPAEGLLLVLYGCRPRRAVVRS